VGLGLYPSVLCGEHMRTHPLWRAHEDTSLVERTRGHVKGVYCDITHYGELTLVFLEGLSSRRPHGSAMCDIPFATTMVVYHWRRLCVSGQ
jgi:hypothetical protein